MTRGTFGGHGWRRRVPNALTTARGMVALGLLAAHLSDAWPGTLPLVALLVLGVWATDVLDGMLARRWKAASRFGASLDMGVDRLVDIVLCVIVLQRHPEAGGWAIAYLVLRIAPDTLLTSLPGTGLNYAFEQLLPVAGSRERRAKLLKAALHANLAVKTAFFANLLGGIGLFPPLAAAFAVTLAVHAAAAALALLAHAAPPERRMEAPARASAQETGGLPSP